MNGLSDYIISKHVPKNGNPKVPEYRSKIGVTQGWFSILSNCFLFIIKFSFGMLSNSIALIADAFHTLSDLASSVVVVFGFKMAAKPADKEHPFGHGRAETIAALTIAILIGFAGFEFFKTSIARLFYIEKVEVNEIVIFIVIISIILKEFMARLSYRLSDIIQSDTLKADALHHRMDVLSSILVLVALLGVWMGYPNLDGIMGIVVACLMLYSAYDIARDAIDDLLGKPVDNEIIEKIKSKAIKVAGVMNVHDIIVHSYGTHWFISLHIEIPENESSQSMHDISDQVEDILSKAMDADVVTHIDPITVEGEEIEKIQRIIKESIKLIEIDTNVQDLRVVRNHGVESILFEIPVPTNFKETESFKIQCNKKLKDAYPDCDVKIEFKSQISMG